MFFILNVYNYDNEISKGNKYKLLHNKKLKSEFIFVE